MKFILLVMLFLTGCAHDAFREEILADGKTWRVDSPDYKCSKLTPGDCLTTLNNGMALHAQMLCGGPEVRLFSCSKSDREGFRYITVRAKCLIQCHRAAAETTP